MISSKALSKAEEAIISAISQSEQSLRVSKWLKLDKETTAWQEEELRELRNALKEIRNAREKAIDHEIRIKENKQRKEWFKEHPGKTLIDYNEAVVIPGLKQLNKELNFRWKESGVG